MPEFGDFGDRSPEEIKHLDSAQRQLDPLDHTYNQLAYLKGQRDVVLGEDATDAERSKYYVLHDERYVAAVTAEYEELLLAVEALASFQLFQEATHTVRRTLEREATDLLMDANQVARAETLSIADFPPEN